MIDEAILDEIYKIALAEAPHEAVGILLPEEHLRDRVIQLTNCHSEPEKNFMIDSAEMREKLSAWIFTTKRASEAAIWHSHPSGGVGPSRVDMRNRVKGLKHLVVTLGAFGPIATWY